MRDVSRLLMAGCFSVALTVAGPARSVLAPTAPLAGPVSAWKDVPLTGFQKISIDGLLDVDIEIGNEYRLLAAAPDSSAVQMRVDNGTLFVELPRSHPLKSDQRRPSPSPLPVVRIRTPRLDAINIVQGGTIRIHGLREEADMRVSGGTVGLLTARGRTRNLHVRARGVLQLDLSRLEVRSATVSLNQLAELRLRVGEKLDASVNDRARLDYLGQPRDLTARVTPTARMARIGN